MPQFVKFEKTDGRPIWINTERVSYFTVSAECHDRLCAVISDQGGVTLKETPDSFLAKIEGAEIPDLFDLDELKMAARNVVDARNPQGSWDDLKDAIDELEVLVGRS